MRAATAAIRARMCCCLCFASLGMAGEVKKEFTHHTVAVHADEVR
jgi:hypothetical protein